MADAPCFLLPGEHLILETWANLVSFELLTTQYAAIRPISAARSQHLPPFDRVCRSDSSTVQNSVAALGARDSASWW